MDTHHKKRQATTTGKRMTLFVFCRECSWEDSKSFLGGKEAKEAASLDLVERHALESKGTCEGDLHFEKRSK